MNKKGELSYLALLGIVGVVALVGLVLISTGGTNGATGKAVIVSGFDTTTGQVKSFDVSQGVGASVIDQVHVEYPRPQVEAVITLNRLDNNFHIHTVQETIWPAGVSDVQQQYYIQYQDGILTFKDTNPADGVTITYSNNANGPFASSLNVANTPATEAHPIHIHQVFAATGTTVDNVLFLVYPVDSNVVWVYGDGFWKANNEPRPEGVSFANSASS